MAPSSLSLCVYIFFFFTTLYLLVCFWPFVCPEPTDHWIVCEFSCLLGRIIDNCNALGYQKLTYFLPLIYSVSGPLSSRRGLVLGTECPLPLHPICECPCFWPLPSPSLFLSPSSPFLPLFLSLSLAMFPIAQLLLINS